MIILDFGLAVGLILLVAGVLFVLVVIIGVISVSLRKNSEQDDDPLQARLAEYLQSGEVASLEEIQRVHARPQNVTAKLAKQETA